jgi:diacylglycerol kinase family enzyme
MDVVLLHNENAGDETWSRKRLVKLVRAAGFKPRYFELREALGKPSLLEKGKFVIVAGGDGSIRKAAIRLMGRKVALAPLPLGTANNIARSLGLPRDPEKIAAGWDKPRRRLLDMGVATGPWGSRYFIEGMGLGLISGMMDVLAMIEDASAMSLKKARYRLHRAACVAAALAHVMPPFRSRLALDGVDVSGEFLVLEILNIRHAGPALELAPNANPSDRHFDIVAVTAHQRRRLIAAIDDRLAEVDAPRNLATRRARKVRFTPAEKCELRIDDANVTLPAGATVEVTMQPRAVEFLLPR